ncbi:HAD-IA family hydrolase [Candidatus Saccharibacteria bacterium]|nr:HAD-IA family hydrolase [Candidatus Saccharibacteria bacterium]
MVRAIIFDYYNVLKFDSFPAFATARGLDYSSADFMAICNKIDTGQIDRAEFLRQVAELWCVNLVDLYDIEDQVAPNRELLDYIESALLGKYKLAILSNIAPSDSLSFALTDDELKMFDAFGLSCQTGFVKPQREAYLDIVKKLNVAPAECVFIDDRVKHGVVAEKIGMKFVHYQNFAQFRTNLEKILECKSA